MDTVELNLVDVGGLVVKLNSILKDGNYVGRGSFEHRTPRKSITYPLNHRQPELSGKYPLTLTREKTGVRGMLGLEREIRLGYIFVQAGYDASSDYGGRYEVIKLRIRRPLPLQDGGIIPSCSVKLLVEAEEAGKPHIGRRNHIRRAGLFWIRDDLSGVLPTEWFLYNSIQDYGLKEIRTRPAFYTWLHNYSSFHRLSKI